MTDWRNEYLKMCQTVSRYMAKHSDKNKVPQDLICVFENIEYIPIAYELGFENGKSKHIAILHDKKANSITKALLAKVTPLKRG